MKPGPYFVLLLLGVACVGLTVALIVMAQTNQQLQAESQTRQQALNQGILGQQAQQISGGVIQDLTSAAAGNSAIRQLLEKHGYRVPSSRSARSAVNSAESRREESANQEAPKP